MASRPLLLSGGSMRPLLRSGEVVRVEEVAPAGLRPGDVAAYRVDGKILLHRYAFSTKDGLWMFDDAAVVGWHRVAPGSLVGRLGPGRSLTRGWPGLLYGLAAWSVFGIRRAAGGL